MWALMPVKSFAVAKQRLAGVLTPHERARLARCMAEDVLGVLCSHPLIERVIVCGAGSDVEYTAGTFQAEFMSEESLACSGLNAVVNAASFRLSHQGAANLLVVPGDLPILSSGEITELLAVHGEGGANAVTIAPDRWGRGTNLLVWNLAARFTVQYGEESFERHCNAARTLGRTLSVCELAGAALDIDEPADLRSLALSVTPNVALRSRRYLNESGLFNQLTQSIKTNSVRSPIRHHHAAK